MKNPDCPFYLNWPPCFRGATKMSLWLYIWGDRLGTIQLRWHQSSIAIEGHFHWFFGSFLEKDLGPPPLPPPLPPQKLTKLPRARKGPQKQKQPVPSSNVGCKSPVLKSFVDFWGGGVHPGPVRAPRHKTIGTLLKGWLKKDQYKRKRVLSIFEGGEGEGGGPQSLI